ncbi:MAG TPA: glycosyltransferase family 39 protein [Acidobacteriota bacterium]|jgi:4-amino-4-deoxy-L-arabinose transferase-like glycosyltransferase|nr:glycosyltransferase family 39 protein [Acidobacteriota bacterium]
MSKLRKEYKTSSRSSRLRGEYLLFATLIFLGSIFSPPWLMDDVDAANATVARNMLDSGDWVIAHLDGIPFIEKAPLHYWLMTLSYRIFGIHDWAARIPLALSAIALCWLTARFGAWAFEELIGSYVGLCLATCVGLFLFTRILIADAILTLAVTLAMWSFLRALDEGEPHPRRWAWLLAASLGAGILAKGLIAVVLPGGAGLLYLLFTRQLFSAATWRRLHPLSGLLILIVIAAPWHVLATLRNPPYFDFTLRSQPGQYHGFFWFYFINEHVLRFLNLRYPRDYDTVPRLYFWLLHLLWLFPWSVFFPAAIQLDYKPVERASRTRLLALCWTGFVLLFFSFSTTQEYYSMPCYPALALLLASAMGGSGAWIRAGTRILFVVAAAAAILIVAVLFYVRTVPTPGDISFALTQNPEAYKLSLGHLSDLTLRSFAYLRVPLALAGFAFLAGALFTWRFSDRWTFLALGLMMVILAHAARLALVVFDPYMSSRPLAEALLRAPQGQLIVDDEYYAFSSIFFYTNRRALLLNARVNDLEYGSYSPGAPSVFIGDAEFRRIWTSPERRYVVVSSGAAIPRLEQLVGRPALHLIAESGRKFLFANQNSPQDAKAQP